MCSFEPEEKKSYFNSKINKRNNKTHTQRVISNVNKDSARKCYESKKDVRYDRNEHKKSDLFFLLSPSLLQKQNSVLKETDNKLFVCVHSSYVQNLNNIYSK